MSSRSRPSFFGVGGDLLHILPLLTGEIPKLKAAPGR